MAGLHSACVIGILGGYIITQVIVNEFSYYTTWRLAIYIQAVCQFILSLITVFVSNSSIDVKEKHNEEKDNILSNREKSDKEARESSELVHYDRTKSEKRLDTIDVDEIGNL